MDLEYKLFYSQLLCGNYGDNNIKRNIVIVISFKNNVILILIYR